MTGFFIAIGLFIAVVVVMGVRHDRRQRKMHLQSSNGDSARARWNIQNQADTWGGPGY